MRYVSGKEVMELFHIAKSTLNLWKKTNIIQYKQLTRKKLLYDIDSVVERTNKQTSYERKNILYFRITPENELQKNKIVVSANNFVVSQNLKIDDVYYDVIPKRYKHRKKFNELLNEIMSFKIKTVFIMSESDISYSDYEYFRHLFSYFGTNLIVVE